MSCTFSVFGKTGRTNKTNDLDSTGQQARPASVASRFVLGPRILERSTPTPGDIESETEDRLYHLCDSVTLSLKQYYHLRPPDDFCLYSTAESDVSSLYIFIILGGSALGDRVDLGLPYRRDNGRCPASFFYTCALLQPCSVGAMSFDTKIRVACVRSL
jgi:hypothetical protein